MKKVTYYSVWTYYNEGKIANKISFKDLENIADLELVKRNNKKMLIEGGMCPVEAVENQITFTPLNPNFQLGILKYIKY